MKNIIYISIAVLLVLYFKPSIFGSGSDKGAFTESGKPKIILFTHSECGKPCDDAVAHVKKKQPFAEILDIKDKENEKRFYELSESKGLPYLIVGAYHQKGFNPKRFNETLYIAIGKTALDPPEKNLYQQHFDFDGKPKLVMYATSWCGYCAKAREYFKDNDIEYTEWDVERHSQAKWRYKTLKGTGYPLIYFGTQRVNGLNLTKVESLLEKSEL